MMAIVNVACIHRKSGPLISLNSRLAVDMDIHGYIHGYCAVAFAN